MSQNRGRIDAVGFKVEPQMLEVLARQSGPTMKFKVPEKGKIQWISRKKSTPMPIQETIFPGRTISEDARMLCEVETQSSTASAPRPSVSS
jgi:hypothetical protein